MTKRLFAFVLAFLMFFTSMPIEAFATTDTGSTGTDSSLVISTDETDTYFIDDFVWLPEGEEPTGAVVETGEWVNTGETQAGKVCDLPAHTHVNTCPVNEQGEFTCGGHVHTDGCKAKVYDHEEHVHTEACAVTNYACGLEESQGHQHTSECYTSTLNCNDESEGHQHISECYSEELTCTIAPGTGAHTHTEACQPAPACTLEPHTHDESCSFTLSEDFTCGMDAHVHVTDGCGTEDAYTCGMDEHQHTSECSTPTLVKWVVQLKDDAASVFADKGLPIHFFLSTPSEAANPDGTYVNYKQNLWGTQNGTAGAYANAGLENNTTINSKQGIRTANNESLITEHVYSWPTENGVQHTADSFKQFDTITLPNGTTYSSDEYEIQWVTICYRRRSGNNYGTWCNCSVSYAHIHIDGVLTKKVEPGSMHLTKEITDAVSTNQTFTFTLERLLQDGNFNPTNQIDPNFTPITMTATVPANSDTASIVASSGTQIGFGYYKLTENTTLDWKYDSYKIGNTTHSPNPVYIEVATDGSVRYSNTATGNYIEAANGVTIINTPNPETTSVQAYKHWEDDHDRDGIRPDSITLELYANGVATGKKLVLSDDNSWTAQWFDLTKYENGTAIEYTVVETDVPDGYNVSYDTDDEDGALVVINTHEIETTSITATKNWADASNQDGIRPYAVVLTVYADGVATDRTVTVTTNNTDTWTATVDGLPKYHNGGIEIVYSLEETGYYMTQGAELTSGVPEDYTSTNSGTTVTNAHTPETTEITVNKDWEDDENQDGIRPTSITAVITGSDGNTYEIILNAANNWSVTRTDLPKYSGGQEITYTVKETAYVPAGSTTGEPVAITDGKIPAPEGFTHGYEISYSGNAADGFTITNTHEVEIAQLNVEKVWDDYGNNDGTRPYAVVITLAVNATPTSNTLVLAGTDEAIADGLKLTGVWENMPRYRNGQRISYSVEETDYYATEADYTSGNKTKGIPGGYTVTHEYDTTDLQNPKAVVTNTYTPETVGLNVQKTWADADNQDGIRPASVTVELYQQIEADGEWIATGKTAVLNPANEWDVDFTGLPKFHNKYQIQYKVVEEAVEGYETTYGDLNPDTMVINVTNTHVPAETEISVSKVWNDSNNQDGKRPDSVTVSLYGADKTTPLYTVQLSGPNWTYTWEDLPVNHGGEKIIYTVTEAAIPGYNLNDAGVAQSVTASADENGNITITNVRVPETTSVPVFKVWEDADNQDGIRPPSITAVITGSDGNTYEVTLNAGNNWSAIQSGLPKYANGVEITYTISEKDVPTGYTAAVNGNTITNTHTPETVSIPVTKIWDDENNQDGIRPAAVTVTLYANNAAVKEQELTSASGWSGTFTGLPKYAGGMEIHYTVTETNVPTGYVASVDGYTVTNTHVPATTSVTVRKTWADNNNQDGFRPEKITVHLWADGTEVGSATFDATNDWSYTFTNLPKYKNGGTEIVYTVTEDAVEHYTTNIDGTNITNTHTPETTAVTVNKSWVDSNNQDGIRPDEITAVITGSDGNSYEVVLNESNGWSAKKAGLPKYANGVEIIYTISEKDVPDGYSATVNGTTITNTHEVAKTSVKVVKEWEDENDQDGIRPDSVTVTLYENGVATTTTAVLSATNNWQYTFTGLDKFSNGEAIEYSIVETAVTGYTPSYSDPVIAENGTTTITVTNTHEPATINVIATKIWNDSNNQDGKRPASITLHLLKSGVHMEGKTVTVTPNEDGNWPTVSWENLPKYDDGQEISYTVTEDTVTNTDGNAYSISYNVVRTGNQIDVTITNTLEPDKMAVTVEKLWDDTYNQDGLRPVSIRVELYADGTATGNTLDLTMETGWIGSFTGLDVHKEGAVGEDIEYTVVEIGYTDASGYHAGLVYGEKSVTYSEDTVTGNLEITNTHEVAKTQVTVKKVWDDANDQDGIRPDEITVTLYRNGVATTTTAVLNESNGWSHTFTGLDVHHGIAVDNVYTVEESGLPAGYTSVTTGDAATGYTITNTHEPETISVPVTKVWADENNQDGIRPDSVTVVLYQKIGADGDLINTGKTITLDADNAWSGEFTDLDKYADGVEIIYEVEEPAVPDGYTSAITGSTANGYTITNTHEPAEVSVTATKVWNDNNNQDGKRPTSITLHLLANGKHTGQKATLTANGNWTYTWTGLPKFADGKEITYALKEDAIGNGYSTAIDGYTVTNTYEPEKTAVSVWKVWDDDNDRDNLRPDNITVSLYRKVGEDAEWVATGKTIDLSAENNWMGSFTDLDKYADGNLIAYAVHEAAIAGYNLDTNGTAQSTTVEADEDGNVTITNTHEPARTSISVTKVWDDKDNQDGKRTASVQVTLYANGIRLTSEGTTVTLNDANGWTYTWKNLLENYHGQKIVYTVVEEAPPAGYTAVTTGSAASGYTVTNTHIPETVDIPVNKLWDDKDDQDGIRPDSITVNLLADGTKVQSMELTPGSNWSGIFTSLPKYKNGGTEIVYTVEEVAVTGYTTKVDGYTITNTRIPEVAQLNVEKVWADFDNNDGKRPYAVVITLYENGQPTNHTLTLNESNNWKGTWENMPRYHNGQRISYSVVETGYYMTEGAALTDGVPDGYTVTHSYDTTNVSSPTATVTNTYTPETIGLNVQKVWDDDDNRDGVRPDSITVTLYHKTSADGEWTPVTENGQYVTATLTAQGENVEWDATFTGLPKYHGGYEIQYNVVESNVPNYGNPTYKLDTKTGIITITNSRDVGKVSVSVTKEWIDGDDQDGIRPDSVQVTLYANGIRLTSEGTTVTLNAANGWKHTWTNLYEYYHGQRIVYTVVEESVPAGYTSETTGSAEAGYTITNTHTPETISIPVSKIWNDTNDQDGIRPEEIKVTLFANGESTTQMLTLTAADGWQGTFTDLPKYADGKVIEYSIVEAIIDGYNVDEETGEAQALRVNVVDGKISIANSHEVAKTSLTARKVWDDNDNQDGKRPDSVTLHLLADGVHMGESYVRVLNAENEWTYTWDGLDMYAAGQLIRYTVYEEPVAFKTSATAENVPALTATDSYTASYERDPADPTQITVTNSYTPEITSVTAIKVWDDGNNRDGLRPESITVSLLADGKETGKTVELNDANGWEATWTNLPKYRDEGVEIVYTVKETVVPNGYECNIVQEEESVSNTFIITNSHTPATTGVSVTKIWEDEDNNDGKRPDGIIVQLLADGSAVAGGQVILDETNNWSYTWTSTAEMPLYIYNYSQDVLVEYYVQEIGYVIGGVEYYGDLPDGYVGTTAGANSYHITITNTRASEKLSLTVSKDWDDGNDNDRIRPTSVQVTLMKNGTDVETVTLNAGNSWTHTWSDLYKYAGGVKVEYTVRETPVTGYTTGYSYVPSTDGKTITATVTNSHSPAVKYFAIQKVWKDNNDLERLRPTSVTVQLYKDGTAYGDKIVLSAANDWKSPMYLPVYENGVAIQWTVKELSIPRYYSVSYDQSTLTITNTIQSKEVPKTGDYNNLWMWVLLLGVCGTGAVSVVFYDRKKKHTK